MRNAGDSAAAAGCRADTFFEVIDDIKKQDWSIASFFCELDLTSFAFAVRGARLRLGHRRALESVKRAARWAHG